MSTLDIVHDGTTSGPAPDLDPATETTDSAPFVEELDEDVRFGVSWDPGQDPGSVSRGQRDHRPPAHESPPQAEPSTGADLPPHRAGGTALRFLHIVERMGPWGTRRGGRPEGVETVRHHHRAVGAVADLREWLGLSIAKVCRLTGLSESTLFYWVENPQTRPRIATIRPLMATWAVAGTVREVLGEEEAQRWWHSGRPSRLSRLLDGGPATLDELSQEVADLAGASEPVEDLPERAVTADEALAAMRDLMAAGE